MYISMLTEDLKMQVENLKGPDIIRLHDIMVEKYNNLKRDNKHFRQVLYQVNNPDKIAAAVKAHRIKVKVGVINK